MTTAIATVGDTPLVLTVDAGAGAHVVRAVDTSRIGSGDPVTGRISFEPPDFLNGSVTFVAPDLVLVPTASGRVQALSLNPTTGTLTRDDARTISLPDAGDGPYFAAALAASADGKRLIVAGVNDPRAFVVSLEAGANYGTLLGEAEVGDDAFAVAVDPADATGRHAYVSLWSRARVVELDLADPAKPVLRSFETESNPQGIAVLDDRFVAVSNDIGETLSVIDRTSGDVSSVPIDYEPGLHGLDVSSLAWEAPNQRLYATLAGIDALAAYDVNLSGSTPTFALAGRLPTGWWPSGVVVHGDGSLSLTTMRGWGAGAVNEPEPLGSSPSEAGQRGGVQHVPGPTPGDLVDGDSAVRRAVAVGELPGYPTVDCPAGADDFPVPATNETGPSPVVDHVFFIVRENKTFDALFGDLEGVEGEPAYTMKTGAGEMDALWNNLRALATAFAHSDNSYTEADASTQGHAWTTYGRTTDYCERNWSTHARTLLGCGVTRATKPEEGSLFDWLGANGVGYDVLGEIVGNPRDAAASGYPVDIAYPGGTFQSIDWPDVDKACHVAARVRVFCNSRSFVYMTLPNDHTVGVSPNHPSPELMVATNDEATGMVVHAISHSPLWKSSLIVITEDDPQQGGDHVDYHRVPTVFISPWVKHGYVSKTHINVAGLHKIFANVFGIPYPNLGVKNAALPFDLFTSTPDYTPYSYRPRSMPLECGAAATRAEQTLTDSWRWDRVDDQPGIDAQVMRWMRGRQIERLTPRMQHEIAARASRH